MSIAEMLVWLKTQSSESIDEFNEGIKYYHWGNDLPEAGQFSVSFRIGWQFAKLQDSN